MFQLPPDFSTQVASGTTSFLASFATPIELVTGVLLGVIVVEVFIHAIRGK